LLSPTKLRSDCIIAEIRRASGEAVVVTSVCEIDPPFVVDFSGWRQGEMSVTEYTRDPRQPQEECVPLYRTDIRVKSNATITEENTLLLQGEAFDVDRARSLVADVENAIRSDRSGSLDRLENCLGTLRNMAIDSPEQVLQVLDGLSRKADGAYAETIDDYRAEITAIKEMQR
jgi:hypothetical protein